MSSLKNHTPAFDYKFGPDDSIWIFTEDGCINISKKDSELLRQILNHHYPKE